MAVFLTKKELRSKRFVEKEMFIGVKLGGPNNMLATYESRDIENGVELGLCDSITLFRAISPFTTMISQFRDMSSIKKISFKIEIKTEKKTVKVGEFYYKIDGSSIKPKMEVLKINEDLFPYLDQPLKIIVKVFIYHFPLPPLPKEDLDKFCSCKGREKWDAVECSCCLKPI